MLFAEENDPERIKNIKIYREHTISRNEKIVDYDIHPEEDLVLILDKKFVHQYFPKKHDYNYINHEIAAAKYIRTISMKNYCLILEDSFDIITNQYSVHLFDIEFGQTVGKYIHKEFR